MANEIVLPWENAKVIPFLAETSLASVVHDGTSLFVSTADERFVQVIVKDNDAPRLPGITLVMTPSEDIPGQHYVLASTSAQEGAAWTSNGLAMKTSDYEDALRKLIRQAALNQLPNGFSVQSGWEGRILRYKTSFGVLVAIPVARAVGNHFAIEFYDITNEGSAMVELHEASLLVDGVRAASFVNGKNKLSPGDATRLVWVRDSKS